MSKGLTFSLLLFVALACAGTTPEVTSIIGESTFLGARSASRPVSLGVSYFGRVGIFLDDKQRLYVSYMSAENSTVLVDAEVESWKLMDPGAFYLLWKKTNGELWAASYEGLNGGPLRSPDLISEDGHVVQLYEPIAYGYDTDGVNHFQGRHIGYTTGDGKLWQTRLEDNKEVLEVTPPAAATYTAITDLSTTFVVNSCGEDCTIYRTRYLWLANDDNLYARRFEFEHKARVISQYPVESFVNAGYLVFYKRKGAEEIYLTNINEYLCGFIFCPDDGNVHCLASGPMRNGGTIREYSKLEIRPSGMAYLADSNVPGRVDLWLGTNNCDQGATRLSTTQNVVSYVLVSNRFNEGNNQFRLAFVDDQQSLYAVGRDLSPVLVATQVSWIGGSREARRHLKNGGTAYRQQTDLGMRAVAYATEGSSRLWRTLIKHSDLQVDEPVELTAPLPAGDTYSNIFITDNGHTMLFQSNATGNLYSVAYEGEARDVVLVKEQMMGLYAAQEMLLVVEEREAFGNRNSASEASLGLLAAVTALALILV